MQDIRPPISIQRKQRSRRFFSDQEKNRILDEAAASSVSEAARNNNISTSLLFQWRKDSENLGPLDHRDLSPESDQVRTMVTIQRLEAIEILISDKLVAEIRSEKMTAYNAATAFGSMTNAVAKLAQLKFEVLQRYQFDNDRRDPIVASAELSLVEELEAERLCLDVIKISLAEKKRLAERVSASEKEIEGHPD